MFEQNGGIFKVTADGAFTADIAETAIFNLNPNFSLCQTCPEIGGPLDLFVYNPSGLTTQKNL
jgi:hypothetical protein